MPPVYLTGNLDAGASCGLTVYWRNSRDTAMRHRITPKLLLLVIVLAGSITLLGACGQKGPLYLPEEPEQTEN
jgi:predicted small lipoprotein YifL